MTDSTASNGADALFQVLRNWGVRYVFTCPGSTEAAFLDTSLSYPDVNVVYTTHESVAVSMADGLSRATGEPAVAYLHANVGLANGIAALYAARVGRSRVVVVNGMKSRIIQHRAGFTTAAKMGDFVRQYVKWDSEVLRAEAIGEELNRAFKVAYSDPPGPTWIGIAQDLLETDTSIVVPDARRYRIAGRTRPDPELVAEGVKLLEGARRPVLVAGDGVVRADAVSQLIALSERLRAPVVHEDRWSLESLPFPADHPHFAGTYLPASQTVQDADVIAFVGARCFTEFEPPKVAGIPPRARVIHIHSDANEIGKIYGVDVALVADAGLALDDLLDGLPRPDGGNGDRDGWLQAARAEHGARSAPAPSRAGDGPIQVPALARTLASLVDERTTVVDDSTTSRTAFLDAFAKSPSRRLHTSASGCLGWGVGAALGIQLGAPDQHVVAVVGDGVFQFGLPGLWTAARYRIPVTYVVVNNQAYAAVGAAVVRYGGQALDAPELPGLDLSGPDIAAISRGFGISGVRVERLDELPSAFQDAREQAGPTVIEVMTDPTVLGPPFQPGAAARPTMTDQPSPQ